MMLVGLEVLRRLRLLLILLSLLLLLLLWVNNGREDVGGGGACATVSLVVVGVAGLQHGWVSAGRHGLPPDLGHGDEIGDRITVPIEVSSSGSAYTRSVCLVEAAQ